MKRNFFHPFLTRENPEERDIFYLFTTIVFYKTLFVFFFSFFLASFFMRYAPLFLPKNEGREKFLLYADLLSAILFFLPVILAGIFFLLHTGKNSFAASLDKETRFPLMPPGKYRTKEYGKKTCFLFFASISAGFLIQIPILLFSCFQKFLFLKLGFSFPAQEKILLLTRLLTQKDPEISTLLLFLVSPLLLAPLAEEIFFRLIVFQKLSQHMKKEYAIWATSILFALLHGNICAFIPLLFVGYICEKVFLKSMSLLAAILLHISFNFSSVLLLFLMR